MNPPKRFLWLAASITFPIVVCSFFNEPKSGENIGLLDGAKLLVLAVGEIVFISMTVSEFIKHWIEESHQRELRMKAERDEDIKRWREEFFADLTRYRQALKTLGEVPPSLDSEPAPPPLSQEPQPLS